MTQTKNIANYFISISTIISKDIVTGKNILIQEGKLREGGVE